MAIDGFDEILNTIYIAKKLHDMGKYEAVKGSFYDVLEYDVYYENMLVLIENIFAYYDCTYYERHNVEVYILILVKEHAEPAVVRAFRFRMPHEFPVNAV